MEHTRADDLVKRINDLNIVINSLTAEVKQNADNKFFRRGMTR